MRKGFSMTDATEMLEARRQEAMGWAYEVLAEEAQFVHYNQKEHAEMAARSLATLGGCAWQAVQTPDHEEPSLREVWWAAPVKEGGDV